MKIKVKMWSIENKRHEEISVTQEEVSVRHPPKHTNRMQRFFNADIMDVCTYPALNEVVIYMRPKA